MVDSAPSPARPEATAARTLALVARLLERSTRDLSLAQYRVLALVSDGDERASRVAQRLAVARPTVTAVVDGLVERGLLRRETVVDDRRAARLVVTPAGHDAVRDAEDAMTGVLEPLFAGVSDRHAFDAGLAEIGRVLRCRLEARLGAPAAPPDDPSGSAA